MEFYGQVYAGAKPFVEKVINHLAEGLLEALLNVFTENKTKVLKSLDVQGYRQLMLEVHADFLLFCDSTFVTCFKSTQENKNCWIIVLREKPMQGSVLKATYSPRWKI